MPTLLASCRRGKEEKLPVSGSDKPMGGIEPGVRGMGHSSSPKSASEPPAPTKLLIPVLRTGKEPTQRFQAEREARSQTRTDRNRAQDSNRCSKAIPEREESGGFRHRQLEKVSRRREIWDRLGEKEEQG